MRRLWPASAPGRLALIGLAAAVVISGGVYLAWPRPAPGLPAAVARPNLSLLVSAGMPGRGSTASVIAGEELTVTGHALGASTVVALELWDDDQRAAVTTATNDAPALDARWTWSSGEAGEHVLLVRAVDEHGSVVQSDALRVTVDQAPVGMLSRSTLAMQETAPAYALALPAVQAEVKDCELSLTLADGEATGFAVLGLPPGTTSFVPLGTTGATDGKATLSAPLPVGSTFLAVTAFTAEAEVFGSPTRVDAPANCGADGWSGELRLANGRLTPAPAVDRAYLYLALDGGAARRVPDSPKAFVVPVAGELDFSPYLPALDATSIALEAWGWAHGQLRKLGGGTWEQPPATGGGAAAPGGWFQEGPPIAAVTTSLYAVRTSTISGGPCGKEFCPFDELLLSDTIQRPGLEATETAKKKLRWSTVLNDVTQLVWQITPFPLSGSANLNPPFLVDQFTVPVDLGTSGGDYTIDFTPYLTASTAPMKIGDANDQTVAQVIPDLFPGSATAAPSPTTAPSGGGGSGNLLVGDGLLAGSPIGYGSRFYVRIIPIRAGGIGQPSGTVTFDVVDPPPGMQLAPSAGPGVNAGAYDISFEVTLPKAADPKYARCALVTEITSSYVPSVVIDYKAYLASGKPLCYSPPSGGWDLFDAFDAFVEFVADVWDAVVDASVWIKAQVVNVVLAAVPCKEIADDDICETIANTALDAALASFGVPPSLPNFDAVVAATKGDLAEFIVTAASSLPGVDTACGLADSTAIVTDKLATCQELAEAAIDEAVDQMLKARSDAAGKASGYAWPGVVFRPDPRGQYQPPSVTFTATRTSDPVLPSQCSVSASIGSVVEDWTWPELIYSKTLGSLVPSEGTGTVSGSPFLPAGAPIPPLEPGQSFSRQVWLTQPVQDWTESQAAWKYWHYDEGLQTANRAWVLLQKDAQLTFELSGNCTPTVSQSYVLTQAAGS